MKLLTSKVGDQMGLLEKMWSNILPKKKTKTTTMLNLIAAEQMWHKQEAQIKGVCLSCKAVT